MQCVFRPVEQRAALVQAVSRELKFGAWRAR